MARRHSPAVYRRRRLVFVVGVLAVLALVIALIWWAASQAGGDTNETPNPGLSSGPLGEPDPTEEPVVAACVAGNITVSPLTDATEYPSGVQPQLSIELTNNGTADCTIDVGTTTQVFTITSGQDVWWRSTDCQEEPQELLVTLEAGRTVSTSTPVLWDRTRSSTSTCDAGNRQNAPGGGASYHLSVSIGGFASTSTKQIFLY